jgi:hypothetical protein
MIYTALLSQCNINKVIKGIALTVMANLAIIVLMVNRSTMVSLASQDTTDITANWGGIHLTTRHGPNPGSSPTTLGCTINLGSIRTITIQRPAIMGITDSYSRVNRHQKELSLKVFRDLQGQLFVLLFLLIHEFPDQQRTAFDQYEISNFQLILLLQTEGYLALAQPGAFIAVCKAIDPFPVLDVKSHSQHRHRHVVSFH